MFGHGLKSLLGQETECNVIGQAGEVDQAIEQIRDSQPDVVIVDSDTPSEKATYAVLDILKQNSEMKVIGLNLQNNKLYVYSAMEWVVTGVEDLLDAITADEW